MSAGELPPLTACWLETAVAEMSTANRKPIRDCLIVGSSRDTAAATFRAHSFNADSEFSSKRQCISPPVILKMVPSATLLLRVLPPLPATP